MAPASTKHICHIVPNYLLKAIAECDHNDEEERTCAHHSMEVSDHIVAKRVERLQALTAPRGLRLTLEHLNQHQSIVPDILLRQIAESEEVDEETRVCARRDLEHIKHVQERYQATQGLSVPSAEGAEVQIALAGKKKTQEPGKTYRAIYDAKNSSNENALPGTLVRAEGQPPVEDAVVNEAFDNAGKVLEFYEKMFNWKSIDNRNMQVISSVHFGKNYENACE